MRQELERHLDLLSAVERGETVSQATLSQRVGIAVGLVNALLKRAVRKGFVKVSEAPARRYAYYLTPTGLAEKSRLVGAYLHHSLEFFREARADYLDLLLRAAHAGRWRVVLVGGGELAEIALIAAANAGSKAVAVISADINRERHLGLPVYASIEKVKDFDLALLTTYEGAQQRYDLLVRHLGSDRVAAPSFLRVVEEPNSENRRKKVAHET